MGINEIDPITDHHDGLGLNDALVIERDERDPNAGNASHNYVFTLDGAEVGRLQFQHGARNIDGSEPGLLDAALVAVLLDRFRGFQSGPFSCRENALVATKLEEGLLWMKHRAFKRHAQGVLGTNARHV